MQTACFPGSPGCAGSRIWGKRDLPLLPSRASLSCFGKRRCQLQRPFSVCKCAHASSIIEHRVWQVFTAGSVLAIVLGPRPEGDQTRPLSCLRRARAYRQGRELLGRPGHG